MSGKKINLRAEAVKPFKRQGNAKSCFYGRCFNNLKRFEAKKAVDYIVIIRCKNRRFQCNPALFVTKFP